MIFTQVTIMLLLACGYGIDKYGIIGGNYLNICTDSTHKPIMKQDT